MGLFGLDSRGDLAFQMVRCRQMELESQKSEEEELSRCEPKTRAGRKCRNGRKRESGVDITCL